MALRLALVSATVVALASGTARAKSASALPYPTADVWAAAVRFLRVDRGYEVVEKDLDAAYVLFRYPIPGRKADSMGSIEIVETGAGVKVIVSLAQLPSSHEALLRDGLLRKMRDEYGAPPPRSASKPKTPEKKRAEADDGAAGDGNE